MADIRSTDPNATGYRRARFRIGWAHAVSGQRYSDDVLGDVTWQTPAGGSEISSGKRAAT